MTLFLHFLLCMHFWSKDAIIIENIDFHWFHNSPQPPAWAGWRRVCSGCFPPPVPAEGELRADSRGEMSTGILIHLKSVPLSVDWKDILVFSGKRLPLTSWLGRYRKKQEERLGASKPCWKWFTLINAKQYCAERKGHQCGSFRAWRSDLCWGGIRMH